MKTSESSDLRITEYVLYGMALVNLVAVGPRITKMGLDQKDLMFGLSLTVILTVALSLGGILMGMRREIATLKSKLEGKDATAGRAAAG